MSKICKKEVPNLHRLVPLFATNIACNDNSLPERRLLCETVSFQSSCFTFQCSDCYIICFMLRCDGDVKGIGENRKLLKEKNVGKIS